MTAPAPEMEPTPGDLAVIDQLIARIDDLLTQRKSLQHTNDNLRTQLAPHLNKEN